MISKIAYILVTLYYIASCGTVNETWHVNLNPEFAATASTLLVVLAVAMTMSQAAPAPAEAMDATAAGFPNPGCLANCQVQYAVHVNDVCNKRTGVQKTLCISGAKIALNGCKTKC
ncbi:hypothetical protein BGZ83_011625 [Gryganskiella cystojenkinii]|nr:hypothetical protein BGZ83_011625 [Gryganskiella cystojenkinii]